MATITVTIVSANGEEEIEVYTPQGTEDETMVLALAVFSLWMQTSY